MAPSYLLDTNTVSYLVRGASRVLAERVSVTQRNRVAISVVTAMELRFGLAKNPGAKRTKSTVEAFLATVPVVNLPENIAGIYGTVRADLERRGVPIGPLDTIIAAHALALGCTLVTSNCREFRRVPGLRCEDWTVSKGRKAGAD